MGTRGMRRPKDGQAQTSQAQATGHDLANPRRSLGDHRADSGRILATQDRRSASSRLAKDAGGDRLPHALGLPVGPTAQRVWPQEHGSRLVSALEQGRCYGEDLGHARGELPGTWCRLLGMVKCRRRNGQGAFLRDCIGPNPTDRAKNGTKRRLIVDQDGGLLGATIAGANVHDAKLLRETINAIVVERPEPTAKKPQHLCLNKGYDNPMGHQAAAACDYSPHVRRIGEDAAAAKKKSKQLKPRRWVVEHTMSWLSKCRGILVRYDKNSYNYLCTGSA